MTSRDRILAGVLIKLLQEFCGLRSKSYSILVQEENAEIQKSVAAGVKKSAQKTLKHEMYCSSLFNLEDHYVTQTTIRSFNHQLSTVQQTKRALTPYDDKYFLLEDGITCRPYGHFLNK